TDGKHTDAKSAFEIPISKGEVIVADRGYQDFELLRFWDSKKAFFVVRHRLDLLTSLVKIRKTLTINSNLFSLDTTFITFSIFR
ncbi:MAG: hypothetical protein RRY13_08650, partial [Akkermansia sp.]